MKNFIKSGNVVSVTAPYNVASGQAVQVGAIIGVAANDALQGTPVELVRQGIFVLGAVQADTLAIGDKVYWDSTNRRLTKTATNNTLVGAAVEAKSGTQASAVVLLDGVIR